MTSVETFVLSVFRAPLQLYSIGGIILLILGLGLFWYGWRLRHVDDSDVARLMRELERLQQRKSYLETQLDAPLPVASDVPNLKRQLLSNVTMMKGKQLQELIMKKPWLNGKHGFLKGAAKSLDEDDFFSMKHEYDQYSEQLRTIEGLRNA